MASSRYMVEPHEPTSSEEAHSRAGPRSRTSSNTGEIQRYTRARRPVSNPGCSGPRGRASVPGPEKGLPEKPSQGIERALARSPAGTARAAATATRLRSCARNASKWQAMSHSCPRCRASALRPTVPSTARSVACRLFFFLSRGNRKTKCAFELLQKLVDLSSVVAVNGGQSCLVGGDSKTGRRALP